MIRQIIITITDNVKSMQESKFLYGLLKLIEKEELKFTENRIIGRDISNNQELKEIVQNIITKYNEKTPMIVEFKQGKITIDGKIVLTWEYENKNKS